MSSSYFMLKMLKHKLKKSGHLTVKEKLQNNDCIENINMKKSSNLKQCRICLKIGELPIYNVKYSFNVAEAIKTLGGVEISETDYLPKYMCKACYSLLKGAVIFRKTALQSDEYLKQAPIGNEVIDDNNSITDDAHVSQPSTEKLKFKCKTCKLKFKTYDDYISHRKSKHRYVRIQCKICNRLLTTSLYKRHLARHESASHLVCEVCGKLYRKDNLIRHLQLHSFELPFQCEVCPYRGRFLESLKTHMHTHTGNKPFVCDKCNLRFLTRSNLNRHLLTHTQEKPFKCMECNRSFYTKRDMEVHVKGDHTGIKDCCCKLCGNKYGTRKALMRHELRVHNRVKMAKGRVPLYLQDEYIKSNETAGVNT